MTAQHGRKCPSKRTLVETAFDRLNDNLAPDEREPNLAPFLHVHRLGEVSGNEHAQTPTDPLHASSKHHVDSLMSV